MVIITSSSGKSNTENNSEQCVMSVSDAVPYTHGGLEKGAKILNKTACQVLKTILYPYEFPIFENFYMEDQEIALEVGDKVDGGERTFKWTTDNENNIKDNSLYIKDVTEDSVLVEDLDNDGEESVDIGDDKKLSEPGSHIWEIGGKNSRDEEFIKSFEVKWYYRMYWGESDKEELTEDDIKDLPNSQLAIGYGKQYNFNSDDKKYYYIVYPANWGEVFKWIDLDTSIAVDYKYLNDVDVTNDFDVTVTYKVLRTTYQQTVKLNSELL